MGVTLDKKSFNIFNIRNKKSNYLKEENYKLRSLNNDLKIKNKDLNWKLKSLKKYCKILNDKNYGLIRTVSSLVNSNEKLKQQNQKITQEHKKFSSEITVLKSEKKDSIQEIKHLTKKINKLTKEKKYGLNFHNFQEFLAKSYISPIVESPFSFEDKRVFAFMDHLGKKLRNNVLNNDYKPLISIIMPICRNYDTIISSINSVLNQSYTNFELIIIDNCDNDDLYNLKTLKDERIRTFHSDEKGYFYLYNLGLKQSSGDIIMYLNPDNEWDSKYIETMIGAFIELPDADAIYSGQYLYVNFESKPYAIRFGSYNKPLLHNHNFIDLNCFCHKSNILNEINGFDESLLGLSDWDFILKISNAFKIYSIPILLTKHLNYNPKNNNPTFPTEYLETSRKILNRNKIAIKNYSPINKKISIIIPSYESLNELKLCIDSILTSDSKEMIDIIVVDNNSGDEIKKYLTTLESERKIKLILNNVNYGFSFAVNQGIDISRKDSDILILNNDAILTKGSIEHMQSDAYSLPNCGLIVPHEMSFEGTSTISAHVPYAYNNFECDVTPSIIHHNIINLPLFHDGNLLELNFAPFFCTYIKREVYNKTLGIDSELGRHYRSDRIFSDFIRHVLQLKIYQSPNAYVYHKHKVATKKLKETKKEEFEYIFSKNQWEPHLAKELGFKKAIWDD